MILMLEIITHFLRFLWLILKDVIFVIEMAVGLLLILVIPFCLGCLTGFWIASYIWEPLAPFIGVPLGFASVFVVFMFACYLDTVWNKARPNANRPKKRKV